MPGRHWVLRSVALVARTEIFAGTATGSPCAPKVCVRFARVPHRFKIDVQPRALAHRSACALCGCRRLPEELPQTWAGQAG